MLESAGVKPNEVVFIQNGGVGESLAALLNGRVDVAMAGDPYGSKAKNAGFHLLFRPIRNDCLRRFARSIKHTLPRRPHPVIERHRL